MSPQLVLLLAYSSALIAVGLWLGRRVATTDSFFVAERGLGPGLLLATLLAANIGAGSTVGAAALGYRDGLAAWWWVGSAGIGTLVLAFWVGPRIWEVARDHDLLTVGDFLEWRYGARARLVTTVLLWVATLTILAAQLVAVAFVLQAVAGIPAPVGCVIGGLVMTAYFTAGGLVSSAWVNLVQLVVLMAGFVVAVPWVLGEAGGWAGVVVAAPAGTPWLSALQSGPSGWTYLFLLAPPFIVSPGILQKIYGARDAAAVRRGTALCGLALLAFAFLPPLLGMAARVWEPGLSGDATNLALPLVLATVMPAALGSLGLAAVFSAEVSSADAILFMLSTSLSRDLYRRFLAPAADDATVLRVARIGAIAGGVLGTLLAIALGSVIELMTVFYSLLGVSLFVPVVGGLYARRAGEREALGAIFAGVGAYLVARYGVGVPGQGILNPNSLGLLASAATFALLLAAQRSRTRSTPS